MREIIQEYHSDYLESFDKHMSERSGHMFNMFIMRYEYFIDYCSWLFDILFILEERLEKKERILGFIAERLLDIWLIYNKSLYIERNIIYTESQNIKKYINFVLRKIKNL